MSTEPYGTTPLPAKQGVSIRYDPGDDVWDIAQQPKSQQIAAYEGIRNDYSIHGATVLDVNQHFVIYAVKKGLIRILHRHSTLRTLFRGHEGQVVSDIQIFLDGDVLGSVGGSADGGSSTVIIWRVFERTPEIMSEKLLEITTSAYTISRLIWHPFNPNQFWIIHTDPNSTTEEGETDKRKIASLVDTTRISTLPHETEQHAVCMFHSPNVIMDGVMELSAPTASSLTDLDWSEKDVRHVLTTHQGGEIRLWDLRKSEQNTTNNNNNNTSNNNNQGTTMLPACICMIQEDQRLSRCKFLPHECPRDQPTKRETAYTNCFLTATNNNSIVTLWSPFGGGAGDGEEDDGSPTKLQVFGLENPSSSYLLDICYGPSPPDGPPPSLFVLMADQSEGKLFSWHLQSEWQEQTAVVALVGCDYVVPFVTSFPMYSWSTQVQPAADISEDELTDQGGLVFDMKLFSYQSTVIQCLILTSFMCLPPASQWEAGSTSSSGVIVEDLPQQQNQQQQPEVESNPDLALSEDFDGEEYDIGDEDDEEEEEEEEEEAAAEDYSEPPEASALPVPDGLESPAAVPGGGAFANWLGALAVKAPGPAPIPPPPPVAQQQQQQQQQTAAAPPPTTTMLTPADLFPNHPSIQANSSNNNDDGNNPPPFPPPAGVVAPSIPPRVVGAAPPGVVVAPPPGVVAPPHLVVAPPPGVVAAATPGVVGPPPGMNANQNNNNNNSKQKGGPQNQNQNQNQQNNSFHNKKKNNRKGKSRSRSPNRNNNNSNNSNNSYNNKQNGGNKGQQQQQNQQGQDVTILQRKQNDGGPPPPGTGMPTPTLSNKEVTELFRQHQATITKEIHQAVENEMKTTVVLLIEEKVRSCVNQAVVPVIASLDLIGKDGVHVDHDKLVDAITAKVEAPLRATFAESMKTVFIPAFQSLSGQMFSQISASLDTGMAQESAIAGSQKKEIEDMTNQLTAMTLQVQQLATEVAGLRTLVTEQGAGSSGTEGAATSANIAAEQKQNLEREVMALLQQRQYEAAFTKALSASTVEMALFVCRNADLTDVLGGTSPCLSQPILLCLMHQLGTSVVTDNNDEANLQTELAWLQEVSLSINPTDESMKRHLPGVLQQLVAGINDKMMRTDQQARRPLQRLLQVLRGVQVQ